MYEWQLALATLYKVEDCQDFSSSKNEGFSEQVQITFWFKFLTNWQETRKLEINKTLSLRGVYVCLSKQKEEFYMFDVAILFLCLEVDLLY